MTNLFLIVYSIVLCLQNVVERWKAVVKVEVEVEVEDNKVQLSTEAAEEINLHEVNFFHDLTIMLMALVVMRVRPRTQHLYLRSHSHHYQSRATTKIFPKI